MPTSTTRRIVTIDAYADASRRRKKVEMLFAHLKRILRLGRLCLRRPNGARNEFFLAAIAENPEDPRNWFPPHR